MVDRGFIQKSASLHNKRVSKIEENLTKFLEFSMVDRGFIQKSASLQSPVGKLSF